jgi:NAD(P)-dependent dehydrogenase (short-subunit alcohol dehydrogenase family)
MKSVVVTGVSTGIGHGAAKVLLARGFRVFGSVRSPADAERLAAEFGANFTPLIFDVTDEAAVHAAAARVRAALDGQTLAGLVNNAGVAVSGPLLYLKLDDLRRQFEVNLFGLVATTQAFAPLLGVDGVLKGPPGRIVNISSVGGKSAPPFLAPYSASKFALEGLSQSLRRELLPFGIDVIVIGPGAVATAIWGKAGGSSARSYADTPYADALARLQKYAATSGPKGLKPERLGRLIHHALTTAKPKVRYTITPAPFQNWLLNALPKRSADRLIGKRLGLLK